jgi:pimeloyl-ACP methyl ester carboxylesterase
MPIAAANEIDLYYETFGNADDPTILLVNGLSAQCIGWDERLCRRLADAGFHVIRFDNRDCGLSTHLDGVAVDLMGMFNAVTNGVPMTAAPYRLSDMADDAFGLLDALGIERAHIVGASMGGMIVQSMAIQRPDRLLSLTSIMSTTGETDLPSASPEARTALFSPYPTDREGYITAAANASGVFSPHRFRSEQFDRFYAAMAYDRAFYPEGSTRQAAAIFASGDRAAGLAEVTVPTLVIHGRQDTLIPLACGERTAAVIPGANLLVLDDMGHDFPPHHLRTLSGALINHMQNAVAPRIAPLDGLNGASSPQ